MPADGCTADQDRDRDRDQDQDQDQDTVQRTGEDYYYYSKIRFVDLGPEQGGKGEGGASSSGQPARFLCAGRLCSCIRLSGGISAVPLPAGRRVGRRAGVPSVEPAVPSSDVEDSRELSWMAARPRVVLALHSPAKKAAHPVRRVIDSTHPAKAEPSRNTGTVKPRRARRKPQTADRSALFPLRRRAAAPDAVRFRLPSASSASRLGWHKPR